MQSYSLSEAEAPRPNHAFPKWERMMPVHKGR